MTVTVDVVGTDINNGAGAVSPLTGTGPTVSVGATGILVYIFSANTVGATSVSWASQTLTKIVSVNNANIGFQEIWGGVSPTTGAGVTLTVNYGAGTIKVDAFVISYNGGITSSVAAAFPHSTTNTDGGTAGTTATAASVASATNDLCTAFFTNNSGNFTSYGAGQTADVDDALISNGAVIASITHKAGAATVTQTAAMPSGNWTALHVDIATPAASVAFGFGRSSDTERSLAFPVRPDDSCIKTLQFFRPSQVPVPQRWLPTTGQEDRPPPPRVRPDDSSIEEPQTFLRSLIPVPQRWQPTTGQEDRPPPPRVRPDDGAIEEPQFFLPSPNPVPQRWLPVSGPIDREKPPPIQRTDWTFPFFRPSQIPVPITWLPTTGEEDRPANPNRTRSPDESFPWFAPSPSPVPTRWLPITGQEDRPPNPNRIRAPDEPFPWFVRSPVPVPITWLPQWDGWERPKRIDVDPSGTILVLRSLAAPVPISGMAWFNPPETWPPPFRPDAYATETRPPFIEAPLQTFMAQTNADDFSPLKPFRFEEQARSWTPQPIAQQGVAISGIAWWRPSDDARLVPGQGIRRPDDFTPWFVRSPVPVPSIWLPLTGADLERLPPIRRSPDEPGTYYRSRSSFPAIWVPQWEGGEHVKPIWYEDRPTTLAFKAPPTPVGISGISWWRQTEVYIGPPPPQLDYRLSITLKPPPPPVGISGMAWFMPAQMLSLINPVPQVGPPIMPYSLPAVVTVTGPNLPLFYPPIPPFPGGLWKGRGVQK